MVASVAVPASADPVVTQQAVLVKDKSPYRFAYSEHIDHVKQGDLVCYTGGVSWCAKYPTNGGRVGYSVRLFRLKERERRYDYYFVDVTGSTSARRGDGDKGRMSVTIAPTSRVNHSSNVSSVRATRDGCHTYPLNLGVSVGPISASTTVANFSTCGKAQLHTTSLPGRAVRYDIYSLNRFRSFSMEKWVRVAAGAKPTFRVTVAWRADNCTVLRKSYKAYANVKTKTQVVNISAS